jgi:hypothetical protein
LNQIGLFSPAGKSREDVKIWYLEYVLKLREELAAEQDQAQPRDLTTRLVESDECSSDESADSGSEAGDLEEGGGHFRVEVPDQRPVLGTFPSPSKLPDPPATAVLGGGVVADQPSKYIHPRSVCV